MTRRARLICVVAILLTGALGLISSTQTWFHVTLATGGDVLAVPGAEAIPVLAPLCLAVLALGAALTIVNLVLRYILGALTVLCGAVLLWLIVPVAADAPVSAVARTVTTATGIAGVESVSEMIAAVGETPWPWATAVCAAVLLLAGILVLATAHRWRRAGRRFAADAPHTAAASDGPLDAVESWDDLSRGDDPTG